MDLTKSNTVRLPARSEEHQAAFVRVKKQDYAQLRSDTSDKLTLTVLFSTKNVKEATRLRSGETIYVYVQKKWIPLNITSTYQFTEGLRVSSFIHRSIVHAETML